MLRIHLAGEALDLRRERALYWPGARTLIVADVHLGKGAAFRRAGLAIPAGSSAGDLARLDALIDTLRPERLLVLGDLFHARLHPAEPWFADFDAFRQRHATLCIQVLRGNHDRTPDRAPRGWALRWIEGPAVEPPFVFAHEPHDHARGYVIAGHLHPVLRLRSAIDSLRLPAFWWRARSGVLPSFGGFTGGHPVDRWPGDCVHAVTPDGVIEIPAHAGRGPQGTPCGIC